MNYLDIKYVNIERKNRNHVKKKLLQLEVEIMKQNAT